MKDQRAWDELLIEGWHKCWTVSGLQIQYYIRTQGLAGTENPDWKEIDRYILEAGLKRSYEYSKGERACFFGRQEVRALIAARSPKLNNCLWSGKHTDEAILEAIDRFPWSYKSGARRKMDRDYYAQRTKDKRDVRVTQSIKMRQHTDTGSDWSKVK